MLELVDITKSFHEGQPNAYTALKHVSLTLERGKVIALHGPSGSGKTTLLTLIGCLARPTSGRVRLDGQDISSLPERFLTALRRERFGFVFQQFNLIAGMSARDNVMVPAYPTGLPFRQLLDRAEELLAQLNLSHRSGALVQTLSGGEQQRTAIAVGLANKPVLLLADEPTGEVDTVTAQSIIDTLRTLSEEFGLTIVMVTHDVRASSQVDRVVTIRDGRTSSERVRRLQVGAQAQGAAGEMAEGTPETAEAVPEHAVAFHEYVVLDSAGRLQVPREFLEQLGISDRAQVDLTEEGILIRPAVGLSDTTAQAARLSEVAEGWGPQGRRRDWRLTVAGASRGVKRFLRRGERADETEEST